MTKDFSQAEFDADAKRLGLTLNVVGEEHVSGYTPRPLSVDVGDFATPKKEVPLTERIPQGKPSQDDGWPGGIFVWWAIRIIIAFVFIVGIARIITWSD